MAKVDQRYQSSFTLHAKAGMGSELFSEIRGILHRWVESSEKEYYGNSGCIVPQTDFFNSCQIESTRRGLSRVDTIIHYPDDLGEAWCMHYVHTANCSGVDWVTDCGIRHLKNTDDIVFSVMLTTATNATYRLKSDEAKNWEVTVPRFVREVVRHNLVESVSISGVTIPLAASLPEERQREEFVKPWMNWVKTESEAQTVVEIIKNPRRRFSVVLMMGESALAKEEVRELATKLCGKSYICLVSANWRVANIFKEYHIAFDHVRVILPYYTNKQGGLSRHPVYRLSNDASHKTDRDRIIESQTGYVTLFEDGAIYQKKDVIALNHFSSYRKKSAEFQKAVESSRVSQTDAREMLSYAESIQKDYEEEKSRADDLERRLNEWKSKCLEQEEDCRQQLAAQKAAFDGRLRQRNAIFSLPQRFPKRVQDLKEWTKALTNLEISEGALEGMSSLDKLDKVDLAWNMLWHLNTTMHKIIFEEEGQDPRKAFKERSGYDYTANENEDVKKKWPEGHKAVVNGKEFMCWRHIKRGNDNNQLIRIYFEFDYESNRIVISWIGRHLRTNLSASH